MLPQCLEHKKDSINRHREWVACAESDFLEQTRLPMQVPNMKCSWGSPVGEAEVGKKVGEGKNRSRIKAGGSFQLIPQEVDPGSWAFLSPLLSPCLGTTPGGQKTQSLQLSTLTVKVVPEAQEWHLLTTGGKRMVKLAEGYAEVMKGIEEGLDMVQQWGPRGR